MVPEGSNDHQTMSVGSDWQISSEWVKVDFADFTFGDGGKNITCQVS